MEKNNEKLPWVKPAITILVEIESEEAVLLGCKTKSQHGGPYQPPCHSLSDQRCHLDALS